jgi:hypothetical protein
MESLLFHHYLATQRLMNFEEACAELRLLCSGPRAVVKGQNEGKEEAEKDAKKAKVDEQEAKVESTADAMTEEQEDANKPAPIELTATDYLLGLFDLTGELMRFSITSIATSGSLPSSTPTGTSHTSTDDNTSSTSSSPRTPLTDLQSLRQILSTLDYGDGPFARDSEKKLEVTVQSVEKVEKAMYGLVVRGSERPRGWVPEMDAGGGGRGVEVESY